MEQLSRIAEIDRRFGTKHKREIDKEISQKIEGIPRNQKHTKEDHTQENTL
jgi:hypothetical protein